MMSKTVLVVDDASSVRQQVGMALKDAGYTVLEAFDGQDGVEKVQANPQVAMVICDVNMPRMNGLDFVANAMKIRELPIVMLTTEGATDLVARAKAAGAKGWITKPFKPELLIAAVRKLAG
jgi:two-component system chemotaxis response regulator CheY